MANRYAVAAGGSWGSTSTWSDASGGAGGFSVPTVADNVFLDASSGNVTIAARADARSLNCTGYTGTLTHNANQPVFLGDATAGTGNVVLKLVAGMTYSVASNTSINVTTTSATQQTFTTAGKTMPSISFGSGSILLADGLTIGSGNSNISHTAGTLDTNNQTISCGVFTSIGTLVRTLTFGSSAITCTSAGTAFQVRFLNLTMTANTAVVTMTSGSAVNAGSASASGNFNGLSMVFTTSSTVTVLSGSASGDTYKDISYTGPAVKTAIINFQGPTTLTGTLTINGNSVINRILVGSNTIGTARTITAATVTTSNTDWRDITGAGAGSWNLSAITGNSGDCGGNTNITFTSGTTQTATGTASFTWSTHGWTSRVPLPQDDVVVSNSFVAGRIVTHDMPRAGKSLTFSCTGTPTLSFGTACEIYGDLTFTTTVGTWSGGANISFASRSPITVTTNGNAYTGSGTFRMAGTSSITLGDALTWGGTIDNLSTGWIVTNNYNITCSSLRLFNAVPSTACNFGTSTITGTATNSATIFGLPTSAAKQGASNATFVVGNVSSSTRNVLLYAGSIGSLTYTVASSPGILFVQGGGTIGTLTLGSARTFQQTNGTTLNIGTTINATGSVITNGLTSVSASGSVTSPASAALTPSTEVEIVCRASNLDWTPTTPRYLISRQGNSAAFNNFAFGVSNSTSGMLFFTHSNGTTQNTYNSTAVPSLTDGSTYWLKMTWRNSDGRIQFFYAADQTTEPSSWTQIGTNVTGTTSAMNPTPTNDLEIGGNVALPRFWNGNIYRTIVRKTIGGAADFDADFTAKAWGADTLTESANAAVVTLTAGEAQASDGAIRFRSSTPGSAATISKSSGSIGVDYCSIKDSTATGGATFYAVDSNNVSGNTGWNFKNTYPRSTMIF